MKIRTMALWLFVAIAVIAVPHLAHALPFIPHLTPDHLVTAAGFSLAAAPVAGDVKAIRDEILSAFEQFKAANDQELAEIKKSGVATAETSAQVDKLNERISELTKIVNRLSVAPNPGAEEGEDAATKARKAKHTEAFLKYARTGDASGLREINAALSVGTDSAGGYTVPDEFERTLLEGLRNLNVMRTLCTVVPSLSGTKSVPFVAAKGAASWIAEGAAFPEADDSFGQKTLDAYKIGKLVKVSEELLHDSAFDLSTYIANSFATVIAEGEEAGFVVGNNTNQPNGIVPAATVGKTGAAGQTTSITADDLITLYHALKRPYRAQATWLMADSSALVIRKLKDSTGQYLWQPGLQAGRPDVLLGRPVEISDSVPAMAANARSVLFAAMKYYWIADRTGFALQRLNELYAANGQVGFRGFKRADGELMIAEAAQVYVNSAT